MTDKQFRRLNREQLIDIIFELKKREEQYQAEIAELKKRLDDRALKLSTAGSIAEAAMGLSSIFEEAQAVADYYLEEVYRNAVAAAEEEADQILGKARKQAGVIVRRARTEAQSRLESQEEKPEHEPRKTKDNRASVNGAGNRGKRTPEAK